MFITIACLLPLAVQEQPVDRVSSHHKLAVFGTMRRQSLYGFFGNYQASSKQELYEVGIQEPHTPRLVEFVFGEGKAHCRHRMAGEVLWYSSGPCRVYSNSGAGARERPLPALREKYERLLGPGYDPNRGHPPEGPGMAIDFIPISSTACRVFFFSLPTKKIETWETEWTYEARKDPKDPVLYRWKVADNRNPETIDAGFAEDFYVFKRKADYYFVTQSGEMYIAPPPKKGEKSRTMSALWNDKTRPIVGIIEDADNDKVWLFAQNKKDAKLGYYFEMKPHTTFETFDPTKLKPVNVEGRAKRLLEYLPLIRAGEKKEREKGS